MRTIFAAISLFVAVATHGAFASESATSTAPTSIVMGQIVCAPDGTCSIRPAGQKERPTIKKLEWHLEFYFGAEKSTPDELRAIYDRGDVLEHVIEAGRNGQILKI